LKNKEFIRFYKKNPRRLFYSFPEMVFRINTIYHMIQPSDCIKPTRMIDTKDLLMKNQIYIMLDFRKYLNCPECRQKPPYCPEHKREVRAILDNDL